MASERSAYLSDRDPSVGPLAVGEDVAQYRQAFQHALRPAAATPMRNVNMPVLIETAGICASDVVSIRGRLARIAAALGKHIPIKDNGSGPTAPPASMLDQLAAINNVQRDAIDSANSLLAEIEQALGI